MIVLPDLQNKKAAVFGLGATGLATADALVASGAHVFTWDENPAARERTANTACAAEHPKNWPWAELQFLALSPGVPLYFPKPHAIVRKARASGVRILGDVELFAMALDDLTEQERPRVIAVTGSNGKSTTTALIAHILSETGADVAMGGNIGNPALALQPPEPERIYVLELSSFQLDLTQSLRANVAVLLNISPDHLDRHGDMARYVAAKRRIFNNQTSEDAAIVSVDDEYCQGVCAELSARGAARISPLSIDGALGHGVYTLDGRLFYSLPDKSGEAGSVRDIERLKGAHNWQNAAAALAATAAVGVAPAVAVKAMERFRGLPHRMEIIATRGAVRFINDSKATNAEAARRALEAYDDVFWIAGGRAKEGGAGALRPAMGRVRTAYLIGEAGERFEAELAGAAPCVQCGNLAAAVTRAMRDARQSGLEAPVVLLSPAAASLDQFRNFEERGETFRRLVLDALAAEGDDPQSRKGAAA